MFIKGFYNSLLGQEYHQVTCFLVTYNKQEALNCFLTPYIRMIVAPDQMKRRNLRRSN